MIWNERVLLEKLVEPNPWEHSYEGLDNHCHFCDCEEVDRSAYKAPDYLYVELHEPTCPWVAAVRHLGRDLPRGQAVKGGR